MPFDGNGNFVRKHNWTNEAAANTPMLAANFDDDTNDISNAFNNCLTRDGQGMPSTNISWNNFRLTTLATPLATQDAATKGYIDTATANRNMGGYLINNLGTPLAATDAATKGYVDTATQDRNFNGFNANNVNNLTATGRLTAQYVTVTQTPAALTDAANKSYVDNAVGTTGSFAYAMACTAWLTQ